MLLFLSLSQRKSWESSSQIAQIEFSIMFQASKQVLSKLLEEMENYLSTAFSTDYFFRLLTHKSPVHLSAWLKGCKFCKTKYLFKHSCGWSEYISSPVKSVFGQRKRLACCLHSHQALLEWDKRHTNQVSVKYLGCLQWEWLTSAPNMIFSGRRKTHDYYDTSRNSTTATELRDPGSKTKYTYLWLV